MSTLEIIKEFLVSEDFKVNYSDYLKKKDSHLPDFLDNIDLNKSVRFFSSRVEPIILLVSIFALVLSQNRKQYVASTIETTNITPHMPRFFISIN